MNILKSLMKNGNFQDAIFSRLAAQAKENGIKKILVTISDDGKFNTEILSDDDIVVKKANFDFLKNFYDKNK